MRLGLTGTVGAGKSTVAAMLRARGAAVIDADALARDATRDPAVLADVAAHLGPDLVRSGPAGPTLDRAATAARVFEDPAARARLEAIVHPRVRAAAAAERAALAARATPPDVVVEDVPLLFETGLDAEMDVTVVVDAPFEVRAARLAERAGLDAAAVRARDAAQRPAAEKRAAADHVIVNDGDLEALEARVEALWRTLSAAR